MSVDNYNDNNFTFSDFRCLRWPIWTGRRTTTRCYGNGILVDFGYEVGTRWLHVYTVCHDLVLETNWYTQYKLTPISDANQSNTNRPDWSQVGFFTSSEVDDLYSRLRQRETIATIIEDQAAADIFIELPHSHVYLVRGHMAAMTDFILATEQRATFHFLNVAPQWQLFNNGDWLSVEMSSRRLAANRSIDLDVYTGTLEMENCGIMREVGGIFSWIGLLEGWSFKSPEAQNHRTNFSKTTEIENHEIP